MSDRTPIPTIAVDEQSLPQKKEAEVGSEETPFSKIVHDLAGCFFGIRMAAEILDNLEIGEQAKNDQVKRLAAAIYGDCRKGCELTVEVRVLLASGKN